MKHKITFTYRLIALRPTLTRREAILVDGTEIGACEYWPDSSKSVEEKDRIINAIGLAAGLSQEELEQAYIDQWNEG